MNYLKSTLPASLRVVSKSSKSEGGCATCSTKSSKDNSVDRDTCLEERKYMKISSGGKIFHHV